MISRARVIKALNHEETDRVPVDLGGSSVSGINVSALANLRKSLGLEHRLVKAYEPMSMLGTVEYDVLEAIHGDVAGLFGKTAVLGYPNEDWKPWTLPNGTEVLVGRGFTVSYGTDGSIYAYPGGNISAPPSVKMPSDGFYFDNMVRQEDLTNHDFNARIDYADQFSVFTDEQVRYFEETSRKIYEETDYAIFGNFWSSGIGDVYNIPGAWIEHPHGIRNYEDWLVAHYEQPDYIKEVYNMQTKVSLKNLELYRQAVGDRVVAVSISGTDFGTQNHPFISLDTYREFYKPYHKILNDWVHKNTKWKVFFHSCGSILPFLDDFVEIGVDIINPIQFTAAGMDLQSLKDKYGDKFTFWGGGIDTQKTLPFGTSEEVYEETKRNVKILSQGGGFICAAVHNIQGQTPVENIKAFFEAVNSSN